MWVPALRRSVKQRCTASGTRFSHFINPALIIPPGLGGIMLQLQSAFGVFALLGVAWAFGENRRAVSLRQAAIGLAVTFLTAVALTKLPFVAHAFGAINDAVGTDFRRLARRHLVRVRLSRRRHAAVRPEGAGRGFHPGVSGAAGRAGHERADHAVVLLENPAAGGARHGPGCWSARSASAARSGCPPPPTSFSAWWKRRCSSGPIWRN